MARRLGRTLAVVAAICALGATASSATATTVSAYEDTRFGGFYMVVFGGAAENDIAVTYRRRDRTFVVRDSHPIEIDSPTYGALECARLTTFTVSCESPRNTIVGVYAEDGDDVAAIGRKVQTETGLDGGGGNDLLLGGRRRDYFPATPGDDLSRGRRGPDTFDEGYTRRLGSDSFFGGRGSDDLFANDGTADQRLACGRGRRDRAWIDSMLDPRPVGCEKVRES